MGLIVDSSVLIAGERRGLSAIATLDLLVHQLVLAQESLAVSVISIAELEHGIHRTKGNDKLFVRQRFLDDLLAFVPIVPVDTAIAKRAGRLDADLMAHGSRIGFADVLIAATALEFEFGVVTANMRHFERVPGLQVLPFFRGI